MLTVFLFLIINANAISDQDLADTYYQTAGEAYDAGDCANASKLAGRALTLYTKISDEAGSAKTLDLIGEINTCLKMNGDSYYRKAVDNFNKKYYTKCVTWARKAEEQYSLIPEPSGVSKCVDLIADAEKELNKIKIGEADKIYETAMRLFDSEDMINAEAKAKEALEIYTETDYTNGIKDCDALLSAIDAWITQTILEAEVKYGNANEYFKKAVKSRKFDDYNKAMEYAKEAKTLFNKAGDKDGYVMSRDLLSFINADIVALEDEFNEEAASHYAEGIREYLYGLGDKENSVRRQHLNNAKSEIEPAKSIYTQLYNWADSLKDSSVREEKKERYKAEIRNCDAKLEDIKQKLKDMRIQEDAEEFYLNANAFFIRGECETAKESVDNASPLFTEIGDYAGISKCNTLMSQINGCLKILENADNSYNEADACLNKMDFNNASSYLKTARDKYDEVNYEEGVKKCESLKKKITAVNEKKKTADKLLDEADMDYSQRKYEDSMEKAKGAKAIYVEIKYEAGTSDADSLIEENEKAIAEAHQRAQLIAIVTVGVILGAILLTILIWWTRKTREEKIKEERKEEERERLEEELRRKKEEARRREEERIRELEAERKKLKAMVEDEKKCLTDEGK